MLVGGQVSGGPEKGLARVADARDSDLEWIHFALWSGSDFLLTRLYRHGLSIWPDGILVRRVLARCPARRAPCSTRPPKTVPRAHHVVPQRARRRPSRSARSVLGRSAARPKLLAAPSLVRIGILTYGGLVRVETDFGCLQPCTASIVVRASEWRGLSDSSSLSLGCSSQCVCIRPHRPLESVRWFSYTVRRGRVQASPEKAIRA